MIDVMNTRLLTQPFASSDSLDDFIDGLANTGLQRLSIVTAWAKRSGLARIADRVQAFRARGGFVEMIVGVSEGGATEEGLRLAKALSDEAFIFHDPARTFHPKLYLAWGQTQRELLVGSSNMTAGGLGWNYETSLWLSEGGETPGQPFADARGWIRDLRTQSSSCKRLDDALLSDVLSSQDIRIGSESVARRSTQVSNAPEDSDSAATGTTKALFSAPAIAMRRLPGLPSPTPSGRPAGRGGRSAAIGAAGVGASAAGLSTTSAPLVARRWSRRLDNTAAQQVLGPASNPTGNLRLTQAGHGIRHEVYFYRDFFGGLPWAPSPNRPTGQEVLVDFTCSISGVGIGLETMKISHDPARISGQANVPTILHWGSALGSRLQASSYVGQYVTLERLMDGTFRLAIDVTPSGPFLA